MNIQKLRQTHQELLDYMESHGYGKVAIGGVKKRLKQLFDYEGEYASYLEFYEKFIDKEGINGVTKRLRYYRTSVRTIQAFDEYNHYPNRGKFAPLQCPDASYRQLNGHFSALVNEFLVAAGSTCKSFKSIQVEKNILSCFLLSMQQQGARLLSEITEDLVFSFFYSGTKCVRNRSYQTKLCTALKTLCHNPNWMEIQRILHTMPPLPRNQRLRPVLSDEDAEKIRSELAMKDMDILSKRDAAMLSIAMYTGMRGADIAALKMDDIDWDNDTISIIQTKTGQRLSLPLRAVVGNAIYEYIAAERQPVTELANVFLNAHDPSSEIKSETVSGAARRFLKRMGIREGEGQNGIRLFRRYLATRLLKNGVVPRYISDILGQVCSESLMPYIDLDIEHLRECGLDISMFPVKKEVFEV